MLPSRRLLVSIACLFNVRAVATQSPVVDGAAHWRVDQGHGLLAHIGEAFGVVQLSQPAPPLDGSLVHMRHSSAARRALKGELEQTSPWVCVAMSLLAGLSTTLGAGALLLLPSQRVSRTQMAFSLALAGGVMLSVTLLEFWLPLFYDGRHLGRVLLYSGIGAVAFIFLSCLVPEPPVVEGAKEFSKVPTHAPGQDVEDKAEDSPLEPRSTTLGRPSAEDDGERSSPSAVQPRRISSGRLEDVEAAPAPAAEEEPEEGQRRRWRLALVLTLALTAHNLPEGFAVAISALQSDRLGLMVMFAIAMHNIPEGISIALPVYSATGSKWQAIGMAFLSGMAEPLGALAALLLVHVLGGRMSEESMENLLCTVGGVMCAVALKELLPEAWRQKRPLASALGLSAGFLVMWITNQLGA